ncbi:hypothetical protein GCM10010174_25510 [Kutzneria viridogrisea]|uniref:Integral membrane protein n=1 Tax=Kutzneria viridogrisea TaxID=47990 RepID=A0ABR6BPS0_9PSEU|nr:hypothetical protein [Kutzneria viridogrisea]
MAYQPPQYQPPQYPQQPYQQPQYYQQYPQPPFLPQPPPQPGVPPGVLVGVSLWRLVIVACAFTGFGAAVSVLSKPMLALSQQASLVVGIVYTGLLCYPLFTGGRRHEPVSPWWRGAMTVLALLVCVTYLVIIRGSIAPMWSLFEHVLTPLAVLVDFLAIGRNQAAAKWWHPLTWLAFPLAYLIFFVAAKVKLYGSFLNPAKSSFPGTVIGFIAALLVLGYLLYGFGKIKLAVARQHQRFRQPPPGYPGSW